MYAIHTLALHDTLLYCTKPTNRAPQHVYRYIHQSITNVKGNTLYKYKFIHVQAKSHYMMNALVSPECPVNGSGGNIP
jgi:hypothetical protein